MGEQMIDSAWLSSRLIRFNSIRALLGLARGGPRTRQAGISSARQVLCSALFNLACPRASPLWLVRFCAARISHVSDRLGSNPAVSGPTQSLVSKVQIRALMTHRHMLSSFFVWPSSPNQGSTQIDQVRR